MNEPFWESMIRSGITGHEAGRLLAAAPSGPVAPVWCAQRFGQSITLLPDGRIVQIAGEHEDHYDPDFCIYNDVFVHGLDGPISIFGYPEPLFPPTDFHTATLVGDGIYVIGSLGYPEARRYGETPVYRLDVRTFAMERIDARGEAPGWIHEHRAIQTSPREISVWSGKIVTRRGKEETHTDNVDSFVIDLDRLLWRREGAP
jgi:hypothetical protein